MSELCQRVQDAVGQMERLVRFPSFLTLFEAVGEGKILGALSTTPSEAEGETKIPVELLWLLALVEAVG